MGSDLYICYRSQKKNVVFLFYLLCHIDAFWNVHYLPCKEHLVLKTQLHATYMEYGKKFVAPSIGNDLSVYALFEDSVYAPFTNAVAQATGSSQLACIIPVRIDGSYPSSHRHELQKDVSHHKA